jgi:NitT/TauT family transport system substrate-binding protein
MTTNKKSSVVNRRAFLKGSAAAVGGAAVIAKFGINKATAAEMKKVTFITPYGYLIGFAPVLNAVAGGHFEKAGLDITVLPGKGSSMAIQQTLADRAKFVRISGVDVVKAVDKGAPFVAIATILQASPFFVVSPADSPIRTAKDMAGKKIGVVSVGGGTENMLDVMLHKNGIDVATVSREAVGNGAGAYGLVKQGKLAAYIVSTGTVSRLNFAGEKILAWNVDEEVKGPGQVYVTKRETLENEPETVVQFLTAVNNSVQDLLAVKDGMFLLKRMLEHYEILGARDLDYTVRAMREEEPLWFAEGKANLMRNVPARWDSITNGLINAGFVKPVDPASLYTNTFIDKVLV